MKTNVNMVRKLEGMDVIQRSSDGYFDGNLLLSQWNNTINNKSPKKLSKFLESSGTIDFISALKVEISQGEKSNQPDNEVVIRGKRKTNKFGHVEHSSVWMHPYLFIKFAMWLSPSFEVKVIKFVYDELIKNRNMAGDNYKTMAGSILSLRDGDIRSTARALNYIVFNKHNNELRQNASEYQLEELYELERNITFAIDMGLINNQQELVTMLRRKWNEKYNKI